MVQGININCLLFYSQPVCFYQDGVVTRAEKCIMGTMKFSISSSIFYLNILSLFMLIFILCVILSCRAIFIMMFCIEGISLLWGCYIFFGQFADWTSDPDESSFFYCNAVWSIYRLLSIACKWSIMHDLLGAILAWLPAPSLQIGGKIDFIFSLKWFSLRQKFRVRVCWLKFCLFVFVLSHVHDDSWY